ncbi:hypothetical protein [Achromobacter marplatensis]|jgi:hypothetical protein|uniref:hypothetical protein n=1 Tax=Achromobacter marplatensis TaxID=470868 RepID=UPI003D013A69
MEIGKTYNVAFSTGRYEIEYENGVTCIKETPLSYRVERPDGTTRLVGKTSIFELKEVGRLADTKATQR